MDTSVPSLLLVLWLKSLLNWLVVVIQRHYMIRTFSGFFCISLALIDSLLSFVLSAIFYIAGVCLLWILAALYVFWVPEVPLLLGDDEKHQCKLFSSPQSSQVLVALLMTVTCVIVYSYAPFEKWRVQVSLHSTQQCCLVCLRRAMHTFLRTWVSFLVLMIISPLLEIEMHAHLELNVVWLSFLNSFSVALALCVRSFASNSKKSDTITDGFCSWYFCFTYGADEWNNGQQTDCIEVKTLNA